MTQLPNELIKTLRGRLKLSQGEFAYQGGIHRVQVCQIENGPPPQIGARVGIRLWNRFRTEWMAMGVGLEDLLTYPQPSAPTGAADDHPEAI
jgi:DNA-binding XRE family transcriptional regulator